jgi:hypothetical protein
MGEAGETVRAAARLRAEFPGFSVERFIAGIP